MSVPALHEAILGDRWMDVSRIRAFAYGRHGTTTFREASPCCAEPSEVSAEAESLARVFFRDKFDHEPTASRAVAQCGGYLVYAMERYNCTFETVCEVADLRVANALCEITPDVRLPQGPRHLSARNLLSRAAPAAQIIRLAEIICVFRRIRTLRSHQFLRHADVIRAWLDEAYQLLGVMGHLAEHPRIGQSMADLRKAVWKELMGLESRRRDARREARSETTMGAPVLHLAIAG